MAGIYFHIPFCSKACHYCNFHFSTSLHRKPEVLQAMLQQLQQRQLPTGVALPTHISSIYFGGGTPSLLSAAELAQLLAAVRQQFAVSADAEITLEANPDDIDAARLEQWLAMGINRLSMGVQSFHDDDLRWMNRAHRASQSLAAIHAARAAGFHNFSIDLIYGVPGMSMERWQHNVEQAMALQVPHLSCYALTVEEKTALHHFVQKGKVAPMDDALQARHFEALMQWTAAQGYEHYEISNYALPGNRSRHNSSYWQGQPYWGIGPSAHSFDGQHTRWWNIANNSEYIRLLQAGAPAYEVEVLSPVQRMNETIMTLLRTSEGLPVALEVQQIGGYTYPAHQWASAKDYLHEFMQHGWVTLHRNMLQLTNSGKLYADHIASALFASED